MTTLSTAQRWRQFSASLHRVPTGYLTAGRTGVGVIIILALFSTYGVGGVLFLMIGLPFLVGTLMLGPAIIGRLANPANDARLIAVTQKPASIVRRERPSGPCTGIGQ